MGRGSQLEEEVWFQTRDAGELDEAGCLYLERRADDIILRGGENMSPGEIEDVLLRHDAVADAAVVGIPLSSGARRSRPWLSSNPARGPARRTCRPGCALNWRASNGRPGVRSVRISRMRPVIR